jgi:hypothetical protein
MPKEKLLLDDIEKISRGKASKKKIGSRAVPHRLTQKERIWFECAKKAKYLSINKTLRLNVIHIYQKYCIAIERQCIVYIKHTNDQIRKYDAASGRYSMIFEGERSQAKIFLATYFSQ